MFLGKSIFEGLSFLAKPGFLALFSSEIFGSFLLIFSSSIFNGFFFFCFFKYQFFIAERYLFAGLKAFLKATAILYR